MASINSSLVWIRFPGLSISYFKEHILLRLGSKLGRAIKIDSKSAENQSIDEENSKPFLLLPIIELWATLITVSL